MSRALNILWLAALLATACSRPASVQKKEDSENRPNIILINVDDLGWKDAGYLGSALYETPVIDRLASEGIVFTDAYAAAANCSPSRASLMTGLWTVRHGLYTVGSPEAGNAADRLLIPVPTNEFLSTGMLTIPAFLRSHGYHTVHAGKWHIGHTPEAYGFDVNILGGKQGQPKNYYLSKTEYKVMRTKVNFLTNYITQAAIDSLQNVQKPFFLNFAPYAVHRPIRPVPDLHNKYNNKLLNTSGDPFSGQHNAGYASMIENVDRCIGQLFEWLDEERLLDNTVIIFTSDNGGEYGVTSQAPLRAGKGTYFEGGIRVPFIVYWKGCFQGGAYIDRPVSQLDIFPTLLDILQLEHPASGLDGHSLAPLIRGKSPRRDTPLFWHFPVYVRAEKTLKNENRDLLFRTRPGSAIRLGDWKLFYYFEDGSVELYNLRTDIGERTDLSEVEAAVAKKLLKSLRNWWAATGAPLPREKNPEYSP